MILFSFPSMKIKQVPKIYWLLILVFLIGSAGIFYNYGRVAGSGGDEALVINSVLKFFRDFSLADKHETLLPVVIILYIPFIALVLAAYFFLGLGDISQLKELVIIDTYKFIPYFRLVTVIFGVITIYIFYKVCLEIFKKERTALIASYLLATSLLFVQRIHVAGAWLIQTMMILISLYYSLVLLKKQKWHIWDFVISAVLVVLATGVETVGLIAAVPFLLICWERRKEMTVSRWLVNLFLFSLLIVLGIALFAYLNPVTSGIYLSIFSKSTQLGLDQSVYGQNIWEKSLDPLRILILLEPLLFVLAFLGAIIAFRKNKFILSFFGFYTLIYYLVLGPILGGATADCRLLPLIPALAVFAAIFVDLLPKKIIYCGLLIFLINPLLFDLALLKKGSVIEARKWINENIPADSRILDKCRLELNENKEVLNEIAKNYPPLLSSRRKYLLNNPALLAEKKGYFVKDKDIIDVSDARKFQYLAICYFNDKNRTEALKFLQDVKKIKIYDSGLISVDPFFLTNLSNPKRSGLFSLFKPPYFGPNVEIYKLNSF